MATNNSSPETLKKQKLDTDGNYSQTKEEYFFSDCDAEEEEEEEEDSCSDANANADSEELAEKYRKFTAELRDTTAEEWKLYAEMVEESGGFDVPYFPNTAEFGRIERILSVEDKKEHLERLTNKALEKYNKENHSNYQLKRVVKANWECVNILLYYITFEAAIAGAGAGAGADADVGPETFQAKVFYGILNHIDVEICRKISAECVNLLVVGIMVMSNLVFWIMWM